MISFSPQNKEVLKAFSECLKLVVDPKKNKTNTHLKNSYADLPAVNAAIHPALIETGLMVFQSPTTIDSPRDNCLYVQTMIMHTESGEYITDVCEIPASKWDAQGAGSAFTYARRYALKALFRLNDSDDDGNRATKTVQDYKRDLERASDEEQIKIVATAFNKALGSDATSVKIFNSALNERRTALKMSNATPFNPAKPDNARQGKKTVTVETGGDNEKENTGDNGGVSHQQNQVREKEIDDRGQEYRGDINPQDDF